MIAPRFAEASRVQSTGGGARCGESDSRCRADDDRKLSLPDPWVLLRRVLVWGSASPAVRIEADPYQLNSYGISLETIRGSLHVPTPIWPKASLRLAKDMECRRYRPAL